MMAVDVVPASPPGIGRPHGVFEFDTDLMFACYPVRWYHVAPGGQRFYVTETRPSPNPPPVTRINIVENWFEQMKAKVPASR